MTMTMDLRDELGLGAAPSQAPKNQRFTKYGVLDNPFPPSNKTAGNPRFRSPVDTQITGRIRTFLESGKSEVVVVTGTQGLGKTNLLEFYQRELPLLLEERGFYLVVRYTDPEPEFSSVVQLIFRQLGAEHLRKLAVATASDAFTDADRKRALAHVRTRDLQIAMSHLFRFRDDESKLVELSKMLLEFLMGSRIYKRHSDELGLMQRLDTTEAKTQALQDLIYLSHEFGALQGLFLFIDELEKVGASPTQVTTRYLSAIRALIDALPEHLFLILAMTPDAHDRYSRVLPALGGRLQNVVELPPLFADEEALNLYNFYLEKAREEAVKDPEVETQTQGKQPLIAADAVRETFKDMLEESRQKGLQGVTQRAFLDRLHERTRMLFAR